MIGLCGAGQPLFKPNGIFCDQVAVSACDEDVAGRLVEVLPRQTAEQRVADFSTTVAAEGEQLRLDCCDGRVQAVVAFTVAKAAM